MALYQNGILVSGANQLPQMTMAEYLAIPASDRPTYWICTDRDYDDLSAGNVVYGSSTVEAVLDQLSTDVSGKVSKSGDTMSGDLTVDLQNGGADQNNAWSIINLGNNIPKGTVKHSAGIVRLFGHGAYRTDLQAPNATANRSINLPDKNGTVALTSDIPTELPANGGNADRVGGYYLYKDRYIYTDDLTQPTANTEWGIIISTSNWNAYAEVFQLRCQGNNRFSDVVIYTMSRAAYFWGYQSNYSGQGISGLIVTIANNTQVHVKIPAGVTNVKVYRSTSGSAEIETLRNDYITVGSGLFANDISGVSSMNGGGVDAVGNTVNTILKRDSSGYARSYGFRSDKAADSVILAGSGIHCKDFNNSSYVACFASSFTNMSSRRYKENIKALTDEEAKKILDVETVTYDYKEEVVADDRHDKRGVIAEQVESIIPSVVTYEEIDGEVLPNGVDYSKFVPYLIKMVQIQQKEIEELKAIIGSTHSTE